MPYAWGRGDTKDDFNAFRTTNGGDGVLNMTGNTNSSVADFEQYFCATGDGCSGFASVVYGIPKIGTSIFACLYNSIYTSNLKKMDFMVDSGDHIVLFISVNSTNTKYNIYDCTTSNVGRASYRSVSITSLSGYAAMTPWNPVCTFGPYEYTPEKHWQLCTECGYKTNLGSHQMELYANRYRCQVCGCVAPN